MTNTCGEESPPPGPGVLIRTSGVPAVATYVAGTLTVISPLMAVRGDNAARPVQVTVEDGSRLAPVSVSVNAPVPAGRADGEMDVSVGAGLAPPPANTVITTAS
jgi:hypothetical protein